MRSKALFTCGLLLLAAIIAPPAFGQMVADFSKGHIRVGASTTTCAAGVKGAIRWNDTDKTIEMCDGTAWNRIASAPPAGCTGPNAFSFTDQTNQSLSTVITSNTVTPVNCAAALSATVSGGGTPQISVNGGAWTTSAAWNPGQTIKVRLTSSASVNTTLSAVVQVGTTSTTWNVTTPLAFL
jgi:hypothetical protein